MRQAQVGDGGADGELAGSLSAFDRFDAADTAMRRRSSSRSFAYA